MVGFSLVHARCWREWCSSVRAFDVLTCVLESASKNTPAACSFHSQSRQRCGLCYDIQTALFENCLFHSPNVFPICWCSKCNDVPNHVGSNSHDILHGRGVRYNGIRKTRSGNLASCRQLCLIQTPRAHAWGWLTDRKNCYQHQYILHHTGATTTTTTSNRIGK